MENVFGSTEIKFGNSTIYSKNIFDTLHEDNQLSQFKKIGKNMDTCFNIVHLNDCVIMPKEENDNMFVIINELKEKIKKYIEAEQLIYFSHAQLKRKCDLMEEHLSEYCENFYENHIKNFENDIENDVKAKKETKNLTKSDLRWIRDTIENVANTPMCDDRKQSVLNNVVRFIDEKTTTKED